MDRFTYLFNRYVSKQADGAERAAFQEMLQEARYDQQLRDLIAGYLTAYEADPAEETIGGGEEVLAGVLARRKDEPQTIKPRNRAWTRWLPYAAAVLFATLGITWMFYRQQHTQRTELVTQIPEDIAPGTNRAILTLADGRVIRLDEAQTGIVVGDGITYMDGTNLALADSTSQGLENLQSSTIGELTLTTPKGGTYRITLPDGSKVWLNANSTLKYPSRFSGKSREVFLDGEAYFEIQPQVFNGTVRLPTERIPARRGAQDLVPFKVLTTGKVVEVLGTAFNISAYQEDQVIKTTLVEGKVKVGPSMGQGAAMSTSTALVKVLHPGEQATLAASGLLTTRYVNVKMETAWKSGLFYFEKTSFNDLLRQVARWYDVGVRYEGSVPNETFSGIMNRNVSLKTLLEFFAESAVDIQLEHQMLVVRPGGGANK